jgi:hypothetical protein
MPTDTSFSAPNSRGATRRERHMRKPCPLIRDAIRLHIEDRLESGEEIPQPESISLTSLEVGV